MLRASDCSFVRIVECCRVLRRQHTHTLGLFFAAPSGAHLQVEFSPTDANLLKWSPRAQTRKQSSAEYVWSDEVLVVQPTTFLSDGRFQDRDAINSRHTI